MFTLLFFQTVTVALKVTIVYFMLLFAHNLGNIINHNHSVLVGNFPWEFFSKFSLVGRVPANNMGVAFQLFTFGD